MARLKQTILGQTVQGEDRQNAAGMLDVSQLQSGQNGHHTDFAGYVSNAAYVRRNLIAVLIEAPTGFKHLPEPKKWVATLKNLIELHPNSIEGLNATLTVEYVEEAVGGAGEMQETASNVTRERSLPVFNWTEKYGKPINAFFTAWISNLIMDPETKIPNVMSREGQDPVTDILPDFHGMTVLFIEPDPTHTGVVEAWLSTNMSPKSGGEVIGARDKTAAGELTQYSIEFTALTQTGVGVRKLAQRYLANLNTTGTNPNVSDAFLKDIAEDVKGAEVGYSESLDAMAANSVEVPPVGPGV